MMSKSNVTPELAAMDNQNDNPQSSLPASAITVSNCARTGNPQLTIAQRALHWTLERLVRQLARHLETLKTKESSHE